jgi:hypothetical protein
MVHACADAGVSRRCCLLRVVALRGHTYERRRRLALARCNKVRDSWMRHYLDTLTEYAETVIRETAHIGIRLPRPTQSSGIPRLAALARRLIGNPRTDFMNERGLLVPALLRPCLLLSGSFCPFSIDRSIFRRCSTRRTLHRWRAGLDYCAEELLRPWGWILGRNCFTRPSFPGKSTRTHKLTTWAAVHAHMSSRPIPAQASRLSRRRNDRIEGPASDKSFKKQTRRLGNPTSPLSPCLRNSRTTNPPSSTA